METEVLQEIPLGADDVLQEIVVNAEKPKETAAPEPSTGDVISASALAALTGLASPFAGAAQYFGYNAPADKLKDITKYAEEVGGGWATGANVIGQVASPLPWKVGNLAAKGIEAIPKVGSSVAARMAGQGAAGAAFSPTDTNNTEGYTQFLKDKVIQTGEGAGLGAVLGKAGQAVINPKVSEQVKMLKDAGMKYFTPGQLASQLPFVGKGIQNAEKAITSLPIAGSIVSHGLDVANQDFNRAIGNKVLGNIGQKVPEDINAGNDLLDYVHGQIGKAYDDVVPYINLSNTANPATGQTARQSILREVGRVTADPIEANKKLIANEVKGTFLNSLTKNGFMTGEEYRTAEKSLGAKARTYMMNPQTKEVGYALQDILSHVRGLMIDQNPVVGKELMAAHKAFKAYIPMEKAAAMRGANEGVFSPGQFANQTEKASGIRGTATGRGKYIPTSQAAESVLGKAVPDSGTAGRMMTSKMLVGGAAEGAGHLATGLMPLTAIGALYNKPMMGLTTKLATERPSWMQEVEPYVSSGIARAAGQALGQEDQ
jgi:hypothetical protein